MEGSRDPDHSEDHQERIDAFARDTLCDGLARPTACPSVRGTSTCRLTRDTQTASGRAASNEEPDVPEPHIVHRALLMNAAGE
jgi:hypothetical protein